METPLHWACSGSHRQILAVLLDMPDPPADATACAPRPCLAQVADQRCGWIDALLAGGWGGVDA